MFADGTSTHAENNMKLERILLVGVLFAACLSAHAADRKFIVKPRPQGLAALPFSDGVVLGDTLYIGGAIGLDAKTGQPPASAEDESRMVMDAVKQTVETAAFSMDDVVSVLIFCNELKLYDTFNNVYKTNFHGDYPARAFLCESVAGQWPLRSNGNRCQAVPIDQRRRENLASEF
jgi:2-iminobutanoate/2-iminopropanoate deaminase